MFVISAPYNILLRTLSLTMSNTIVSQARQSFTTAKPVRKISDLYIPKFKVAFISMISITVNCRGN
jgi:hypothetical protein